MVAVPAQRWLTRHQRIRVLILGSILTEMIACSGDPKDHARLFWGEDITRDSQAVFPAPELIDADGMLSIPPDFLASGETPVPVERLGWRTGFSAVQTTVIDPEAELDRSSLPPPVGTGDPDGVVLFDLTAGLRIPALVETDAWPDNTENPRLLIRPLEPLSPGHTVAVSIADSLRTSEGTSYEGPQWFASARHGGRVNDGEPGHYESLVEELSAAGLPDPVLAVDFPVSDGRTPLLAMMEDLPTPEEWQWLRVFDATEGDPLPEGTWLQAEGHFRTRNWLVDDGSFELSDDGAPVPQGETEADLFLFVPDSVQDAAPGTVPVWIFGHGIFSHPANYLAHPDDPSGVIAVARAAGAIVLGTTWRGLTRDDIATAATVGGDFGRIPELTDKLGQGVANTAALARLAAYGQLLSDPLFEGKASQDTLRYYGISLGGIEGATLFAVDDTLPHGVLHVGGSSWSTMLERSSNWSQFEILMSRSIPSPGDRQQLYAASQLFWDTAEPALHSAALQARSLLWQGSIGDEQVANLTTDLITEASGAVLLAPSPRIPNGWTEQSGPIRGPAVAWYDPQVGEPPLENRPAEVTDAHSIPRLWAGQHNQTIRFLDPEDPGVVEHSCGDASCTADNPG